MPIRTSKSAIRLPPGCGDDLGETLLYSEPQQAFLAARRLRFCLTCKKVGSTGESGLFICLQCQKTFASNLEAPRLFNRLHLRAGRRSGKSKIGAHAVREELLIPKSLWWITAPTYRILHDATMPTLLRLIPPHWVANWSTDHLELTLTNKSVCQFRSLDDPEKQRGQGLNGVWVDECAFVNPRAWQVLEPSLAENAGIAITTTSPAGFDWSFKEFMKRAIDGVPGYWARRFKTASNPKFQQNPQLMQEIEHARLTKTPEVFAAEYEGEDVNFTGAIYGQLPTKTYLADDDAIRKWIPEWDEKRGLLSIDPSRQLLIGLDSGTDHPFGAVLVVVTEKGLVVIADYLERQQAISTSLDAVGLAFITRRFHKLMWSANKNEAALRLEAAVKNIGIVQAENKHDVGIQRVQSWLLTGQLAIAYTAARTYEQMLSYRYANNMREDGQKRDAEAVFKFDDELPDAVRYVIMAWPELPRVDAIPVSEREQKRMSAFDDRTRYEIERVREFNKREKEGKELKPNEENYPIGEFFGAPSPFEAFW